MLPVSRVAKRQRKPLWLKREGWDNLKEPVRHPGWVLWGKPGGVGNEVMATEEAGSEAPYFLETRIP